MIMTNKSFYEFVNKLVKNKDFNDCVVISDRKEDEQFKLELLLRLLIADSMELEKASEYGDLKELLDKETLNLMDKISREEYDRIEERFNNTFELLNRILGEDAFKKYSDGKYKGPFLVSAFQGIATGIFRNIDVIYREISDKEVEEKIKEFYSTDVYKNNTIRGSRSVPRFKELTKLGEEFFNYEN